MSVKESSSSQWFRKGLTVGSRYEIQKRGHTGRRILSGYFVSFLILTSVVVWVQEAGAQRSGGVGGGTSPGSGTAGGKQKHILFIYPYVVNPYCQ